MIDATCVAFLQWALPRLGLVWSGFRRVHRQVCKRIGRRLATLQLGDVRAYRTYLDTHPEEWAILDSYCRISVSRLMRDRPVFEALARMVLPRLAAAAVARGERVLRCWSAGCASGEEPYTLSVLWRLEVAGRFPTLSLGVVATDIDERLLERARHAGYQPSSLREVPTAWLGTAFTRHGGQYELRPEFRAGIEFLAQDIREHLPTGPFDMILCRNLVFTYFDAALQGRTLERLLGVLRDDGALVIGLRERLPVGVTGLDRWIAELGVYRKAGTPQGARASPAE